MVFKDCSDTQHQLWTGTRKHEIKPFEEIMQLTQCKMHFITKITIKLHYQLEEYSDIFTTSIALVNIEYIDESKEIKSSEKFLHNICVKSNAGVGKQKDCANSQRAVTVLDWLL